MSGDEMQSHIMDYVTLDVCLLFRLYSRYIFLCEFQSG